MSESIHNEVDPNERGRIQTIHERRLAADGTNTTTDTVTFTDKVQFHDGQVITITQTMVKDIAGGGGGTTPPPTGGGPPKPTEGVPKQGGNPDPKTWKIVNMVNNPALFKIVDDQNKNIATDFTTKSNAQVYIDYYLYQAGQGGGGIPTPTPPPPTTTCPPGQHLDTTTGLCVPDSPPPPPSTGNLDVDGVMKFYGDATPLKENRPSSSGTGPDFDVEGTGTSAKTEGALKFFNVVGKTVNYASGQASGKTIRLNLYAPGGKGKSQTHTWKDKPLELFPLGYKNFEFTDYQRTHNNTGTHTESSHKMNGGIHTGSGDPRASMIELTHEVKGKSPRMARELNHPNYDYNPTDKSGANAGDLGVVENVWIGRKVICIRNADGKSVTYAMFVDFDGIDKTTGKPKNNWKFYSSHTDIDGKSTGQYKNAVLWTGFMNTVRTDGWTNNDYAFVSIREIDPAKLLAPLPT